MEITITAIEGTLMAAAAILPLILLLGSVETLLNLLEEHSYRRRIRSQLKLIKKNFSQHFDRAA